MRKPQTQPSLATLTVAEREQLADWLRHGKYNDVLDRATKPRPEGLGLTFTSDKPLRTFYAKVGLFDVINAQLPADKKLSLATFESLAQRHIHLFLAASGDEEKLAAAHQAILNTTIELAGSATTPTQLLALQRLADFPERAALRAQSAEDLSRLREQAEQIRAERLEIARSKENRAKEMHTHKITLDLRKQTLKEKTAAFKQDLALSRLNIKFAGGTSFTSPTSQNNWWGEAAAEPTSTSCDAITKNDATTADPHASTSLSQQGRGLGEGFNYATIKSTDHGEIREKSSLETQNSKLKIQNPNTAASSFLSPAVLANTNLYDQKIDAGEIRVIYAPGKHYEIEYCNPADQPALERMHKSAPLRFFEDPTRTTFLPPLRTFGKNPYIPPTNTLDSRPGTQDSEFPVQKTSSPSTEEGQPSSSAHTPSAPIPPITPNSETINPTAPPIPAPPLTRDQRLAEFYKGMAAHARELHNQLMARKAQLAQENQEQTT